ncbi:hypothetical protein V8G54_000554, partial [Vigna mungo]
MVEDGKTKIIPNNKKRPHNFYKEKMNKRPKFGKESQQGNCWECGKPGHLKRDCTIWKRKMAKNGGKQGQGESSQGQPKKGNCTQITHNSVLNFVEMVSEIFCVQTDDSWWIDSGASRHVCKDRCLFKTFKEDDNGEVLYMGNDSMAKVLGVGQVELLLSSGKSLVLRDVLYAPELRRNLVSGVILNRLGFKLVFESDKFILSKGGVFVGLGYLCNNMFKLSVINDVKDSVYVVNHDS